MSCSAEALQITDSARDHKMHNLRGTLVVLEYSCSVFLAHLSRLRLSFRSETQRPRVKLRSAPSAPSDRRHSRGTLCVLSRIATLLSSSPLKIYLGTKLRARILSGTGVKYRRPKLLHDTICLRNTDKLMFQDRKKWKISTCYITDAIVNRVSLEDALKPRSIPPTLRTRYWEQEPLTRSELHPCTSKVESFSKARIGSGRWLKSLHTKTR